MANSRIPRAHTFANFRPRQTALCRNGAASYALQGFRIKRSASRFAVWSAYVEHQLRYFIEGRDSRCSSLQSHRSDVNSKRASVLMRECAENPRWRKSPAGFKCLRKEKLVDLKRCATHDTLIPKKTAGLERRSQRPPCAHRPIRLLCWVLREERLKVPCGL